MNAGCLASIAFWLVVACIAAGAWWLAPLAVVAVLLPRLLRSERPLY